MPPLLQRLVASTSLTFTPILLDWIGYFQAPDNYARTVHFNFCERLKDIAGAGAADGVLASSDIHFFVNAEESKVVGGLNHDPQLLGCVLTAASAAIDASLVERHRQVFLQGI